MSRFGAVLSSDNLPVGPTGADGAAGSVMRDGAGVPSNSLGANGDYYLNDTTGDMYKRASGTYSLVANIKGAAGAAGATGSTGPTRIASGNITIGALTTAVNFVHNLNSADVVVAVWSTGSPPTQILLTLATTQLDANTVTVNMTVAQFTAGTYRVVVLG